MQEQAIQIFPTSRALRDFYANMLEVDQILPKAMSISEFFATALFVPQKIKADEDMRLLLMQEAADFQNFSQLKIQREFFTFMRNSSYLFRFFEELAMEKVAIKDLQKADTYALFDEHLEILKHLEEQYLGLLEKHKLYDTVSLPRCYELNKEYLGSQKGFIYHLEGFLNHFEFEVFCKVALLTPVFIRLHVNKYNKKMVAMFWQKGLDISRPGEYTIDIGKMQIVEKIVDKKEMLDADIRGFSTRTLQCAFVYEQIQAFVSEGIAPENIAVISPDEAFAPLLKRFDRVHNLNFAMGESFTQHANYKLLEALDKYFRLDELEHGYRISRLGVEPSTVKTLQALWSKKTDAQKFLELLELLLPKEQRHRLFEEELFGFLKLLSRAPSMELSKAFKLFLNRLRKLSIDDVMGGKITVMGLLESRGVAFDGVIVVDFSDEFVPKTSQKDMFLNSSVRAHAQLPGIEDRQNLQRYFYYRLFEQAKKIAISYTQNEQSMASRFLDELELPLAKDFDEKSYYKLLFQSSTLPQRFDPDELDVSIDLTKAPLSASKLKTLLTCKRAFYYKYILRSKESVFPSEDIRDVDIGNMLHDALFQAYRDKGFTGTSELKAKIKEYMRVNCTNELHRYYMDVWLSHLDKLYENEQRRHEEGYRVFLLEESLHVAYKGFTLGGKIDRIDKGPEGLSVLDYKSGKIPLDKTHKSVEKAVDFQLEFYTILAKTLGEEVHEAAYYDLKSGQLVQEAFLQEKTKRLDTLLEELQEPISGFEKSESLVPCKNCAYKVLCNRSDA